MSKKSVFNKIVGLSSNLNKPTRKTHKKSNLCIDSAVTTGVHFTEEMVEKIIDEDDDYESAVYIAPLKFSSLLKRYGGDEIPSENDINKLWLKEKDMLKESLSKDFGLVYGNDYVILQRGFFALMAFLTKDEDGDWCIPDNIDRFINPVCGNNFLKQIHLYYKNTDNKFFCINALSELGTPKNKPLDDEKEEFALKPGIMVDISFLRSALFRKYDIAEGRTHFTRDVFSSGILRRLSIEHKILSFDDELIDEALESSQSNHIFRGKNINLD